MICLAIVIEREVERGPWRGDGTTSPSTFAPSIIYLFLAFLAFLATFLGTPSSAVVLPLVSILLPRLASSRSDTLQAIVVKIVCCCCF